MKATYHTRPIWPKFLDSRISSWRAWDYNHFPLDNLGANTSPPPPPPYCCDHKNGKQEIETTRWKPLLTFLLTNIILNIRQKAVSRKALVCNIWTSKEFNTSSSRFPRFTRQFDLIHFKRETQDFTFFHYIHVISLHSVAIASVSPKSWSKLKGRLSSNIVVFNKVGLCCSGLVQETNHDR